MKKIITMGIGALVVIAIIVGGVILGRPYIQKLMAPKPAPQETEVSLDEKGLGELPEATEGIGTETALLPNEIGEQATESPPEEATDSEDIHLDTESPLGEELDIEPEDLSGDASEVSRPRAIAERDVTPAPRETRIPEGKPGRPGEQLSETLSPTSEEEGSPTPIPTTPVDTATPVPKPTPGPAPGNYSVRTIEPVFKSQLATVRKAMKSLGVSLKEQKTEQQYLSAYRLAVGYFRTKAEAESWAYYNFRPRGIDYYVYPVQGMFSVQVGVYSQQQNVELAMRELYRKFQGGRLPIRTETTTITTPAYELSIGKITKSLADNVWRDLARLGIQAEISGM